jgi:hypothetical protein
MGAATMAKSKEAAKNSEDSPDQGAGPEVSVKVFPADRDLINKVAGARGVKVANLFASEDVREFLTHLLVEAADEEKRRQQAKKKP